MRKSLFLTILCVAFLASLKVYADNPEENNGDYYSESSYYDVYFNQVAESYEEEPEPVSPGKGGRIPSKRIYGSISKSGGLKINGVNISEIYSFEIYDIDGFCIGAYGDVNDFVQAVFSYHDSMEIRLRTADHILLGYI